MSKCSLEKRGHEHKMHSLHFFLRQFFITFLLLQKIDLGEGINRGEKRRKKQAGQIQVVIDIEEVK